ncbi:pentapeptide repeat family protein [Pelomyxa schiedti]|nr:pentapeptide repeat family protein [Pelomyxa schiedti]
MLVPGKVVLQRRTLSGFNFSGLQLCGADFSDSNLTNCLFTGSNLSGSNLKGAVLCNSDLTKANLSGCDLTKVDFTSAKLSGATLSSANLTDANLTGADLMSAVLESANLTNTNFTKSSLIGANIRSDSGANATFTGANLTDAKLFCDGNFANLNLTNATIWCSGRPTNFSMSNLSGANISGKCSACNFEGATMIKANLSGATLSTFQQGCDTTKVTGANLTLANLTEAYLGSIFITGANLTGARFTLWCPEGVQQNPPEWILATGWTIHYMQSVNEPTRVEDIDPGKGEWILVAVFSGTNPKCFELAAAGRRSQVCMRTKSATQATEHRGVYWYFVEGLAFGFSHNQIIEINQGCDTANDVCTARIPNRDYYEWYGDRCGQRYYDYTGSSRCQKTIDGPCCFHRLSWGLRGKPESRCGPPNEHRQHFFPTRQGERYKLICWA